MLAAGPSEEHKTQALALRIAELSSVLKQQRAEIDEKNELLEHNRKIVKDHEEVIRMQEGQLLERDAQMQAQNAEIRALRRQHAQDAEALRVAYLQLQGKVRPSGSMGRPKMVQEEEKRILDGGRSGRSPGAGELAAPSTPPSRHGPPRSPPGGSVRRQLQQALRDKMVLVRALHQLTGEMAQARAEAKAYAQSSERSLSTAWRLGQLGQLGLALLADDGDEELDREDDDVLMPPKDSHEDWPELNDATRGYHDPLAAEPALDAKRPDDEDFVS